MMLKTKTMKMTTYQFGREFAIGGVNRKQLAPHYTLGCTTFIHIDMSRLRTNHCLVRPTHRIDTKHIRTCTIENKERMCRRSEMLTEQFLAFVGVFIVTVCECVLLIGICQCLNHFGCYT